MALRNRKGRKTLRFAGDILMTGTLFAGISYRAIPENMRYESDFGFCLLWLVSLLMGICTTPRSKYNIPTVLGILIIPFSLDYLVAYHGEYLLLIGAVCLLGVSGYTAVVLRVCYPDLRKDRCLKNWFRFAHHHLFRSRTVISAVLAAALAASGIFSLVDADIPQEEYVQADSSDRAEILLDTMGGDADLISLLDQEQWETLSHQVRLAVLQQVVEAECAYLGIPYSLSLTAAEMERNSVRGYYNHGTHEVCLNKNLLETAPAEQTLSTLLHEVYHAFEYAVVEVYEETDASFRNLRLFENAWAYTEEFAHYIDGGEDYEAYRSQLVEQDSNAYSARRLPDYLEVIAYIQRD